MNNAPCNRAVLLREPSLHIREPSLHIREPSLHIRELSNYFYKAVILYWNRHIIWTTTVYLSF